MPRRSYFELHYHITWHTKNSIPVITPEVEIKLYSAARVNVFRTLTRAAYFESTPDHAVNGVANGRTKRAERRLKPPYDSQNFIKFAKLEGL